MPFLSRLTSGAPVAGLAALLLGPSHCSNVSGAPVTSVTCTPGEDGGDDDDDDDGGTSTCKPGDADGLNGGCYSFDLTVTDTAFSPILLKAQNLGQVTLSVTNKGTKPHDFVVGCLPTPNVEGCPAQSCFPAAANLGAIAPGASARTTFATPNPEGIYLFRSDVSGDSQVEGDGGVTGLWGQFIVQ